MTEVQADRQQGVLLLLALSVIALLCLFGLTAYQYHQQELRIDQACAQTGAAAKLNLSSFVPLCENPNS